MGNVSIVISVAPAIGPTIVGPHPAPTSMALDVLLVLPIALAMLVIGVRRIAERQRAAASPRSTCSPVILSAFGFGGLVYGLEPLGERA